MKELLLTTSRFKVERRTFNHSNDHQIKREIVVHPGAVAVIPILDDRWLVMIRNFRYTAGCELWEIPAGTLEKGEKPIACAKRELEEETGYHAGHLTPMGEFYTSPGFTDEIMHVYKATHLSLGQQKLDDQEKIVVELVNVDRAREMLVNCELRDGKTIAVLGLYFLQSAA